MSFSALDREKTINTLKSESFDLLVIGGGITGAGIALDAASRGLKTALVEKNDFAFGTSSRSTKLIHGGLRYLKQLEFALVKEVGSERAIVHRLAAHLVVPEKMLLPLYEKRGLGYWLTSIGLKIYDWLAGVKPEDQRKMLTKLQTINHEPLLKNDDIKGGAIYAEYRTDDARLTIEIAKAASAKGALMVNYMRVTDFEYQDEHVTGVNLKDELSGAVMNLKARTIINAAGPWVDELRELNHSKQNKHLHLTKGVHIVVPYHRLPVRQAIYFDVPDGRMIFAIPRGRITYIGTTDTDYSGDKENVFTTKEDARYLVDAVNETFPSTHLTLADIESCWAGLRPLIHEEGKSASELSRKDEIFESSSGLISIAGGKLTGYRKMAERVVDLIAKKKFEERMLPECTTDSILLAGGGLKNISDVAKYNREIAARVETLGLKGDHAAYLVHLYGKQSDTIINYALDHKLEDPEITLALAELWYGVNNEMVVKATDFYVRRTGLLYFNIHRMNKIKEPVLLALKSYFRWDDSRLKKEQEEIELLTTQTLNFKN
ncbi:MAG: glycerol-3-phosphate dehydrogenase/oxidase [Cyclobacteriaceae bacterium]|nr:glycerol-3-phosphate dehydrogenase/oxidase [Cyclobacteriaceae bacterium]